VLWVEVKFWHGRSCTLVPALKLAITMVVWVWTLLPFSL